MKNILNKGDAEKIRFCQLFGLIPKKKKCPTCKQGISVAYKRGHGRLVTWRCGMAACRYEITVRAGTIFERSKPPNSEDSAIHVLLVSEAYDGGDQLGVGAQ